MANEILTPDAWRELARSCFPRDLPKVSETALMVRRVAARAHTITPRDAFLALPAIHEPWPVDPNAPRG